MEDTYEPFGDGWKKEVMRLPKVELVKLYADACLKSQRLEQQLGQVLRLDQQLKDGLAVRGLDGGVILCESKGGAR